MKTKIYLKDLKDYFNNELNLKPKHDLNACKIAFNQLNKEFNIDIDAENKK